MTGAQRGTHALLHPTSPKGHRAARCDVTGVSVLCTCLVTGPRAVCGLPPHSQLFPRAAAVASADRGEEEVVVVVMEEEEEVAEEEEEEEEEEEVVVVVVAVEEEDTP